MSSSSSTSSSSRLLEIRQNQLGAVVDIAKPSTPSTRRESGTHIRRLRYDYRFVKDSTVETITPLFAPDTKHWNTLIWHRAVNALCANLRREDCDGKRMIELGAALAVPSFFVATRFDPALVVATDREEDLGLLSSNLVVEDVEIDNAASTPRETVIPLKRAFPRLELHALDWNRIDEDIARIIESCGLRLSEIRDRDDDATAARFDCIIAVECISKDVYGAASLTALRATIERIASRQSCVVYLVSERRAGDGLEDFVEMMRDFCAPERFSRVVDRDQSDEEATAHGGGRGGACEVEVLRWSR